MRINKYLRCGICKERVGLVSQLGSKVSLVTHVYIQHKNDRLGYKELDLNDRQLHK